jgi:hypothetical protein
VSAVKDFYRQLGLKALRIFVDPSGIAPVHLNVVGVPTTLLIDPDGREIGRWIGPAQWDSPDMIATLRAQLNAPAAYVGRTAER